MHIKSNTYKDLEVWKKSISLTKTIYQITLQLPTEEKYGLRSQLQRSAVSVAANIAEGQARHSKKEFRQFLGISLGSLAELETLLIIGCEVSIIDESSIKDALNMIDEITRMIKGILKHLAMA
jgi:four helix bundle protein